jgi:hypothetical protein
MTELLTTLAAPAAREQLLQILREATGLRGGEILTLAEHEQLQAILQAALRRVESTAAPSVPGGDDEILDALQIDADPNGPDVLDAPHLSADDDVLDAVPVGGSADDADVLDAIDLSAGDGPEGDGLDAVELGDVEDGDVLDALPLDGLGECLRRGAEPALDLSGFKVGSGTGLNLDLGSDMGQEDGGTFHFDFGGDVAK